MSQRSIRVAVVGFGNVGRAAMEAALAAPDMEVAAVVRRSPDRADGIPDAVPVVADLQEVEAVDVALLCVPTRSVPETAERYLRRGINTVDSFDIHGQAIVDLRNRLDQTAKAHNAVAICAAGWDPGTDSVLRLMFEYMAPRGITHTNFGPGMSMGHTVAAKAIDGVRNALSLTVPAGQGRHRRIIYVELENGADFATVERSILNDPYFKHDDSHVVQVDDVSSLINVAHGVEMERIGVSGTTHNQRFWYRHQINNPALTSQVMVAAARATVRQQPGAYTMLEVPPIDFHPGDREDLIRRLV